MKLNKNQRKLTGDIFGNLAVGWFGGGVIIPLFNKQISADFIPLFIFGILSSLSFYFLAILIVKR